MSSIIYQPQGRAGEYAGLAVNLYTGCNHGCLYCYVPKIIKKTRQDFHSQVIPRPEVLKRLELECKRRVFQDLPIPSFCGQQLTKPIVLLSFTTDTYNQADEELQLTRQAISILHQYGYAVDILTKAGSKARRDFDLLTKDDAHAATLTVLDDAHSRKIEPQAALPQDRIDTLALAHDCGIRTWVSLEPVIDPQVTLQIIQQTYQHVDLYKVGKLNHAESAKQTDWRRFGHDAQDLLTSLNKSYYLKDDLKKLM